MGRLKLALWMGASVLAMSPGVAAAQTGNVSQGSVAPQADAQPQSGVEDIIVTAQRRNERQQDVPIAITTITAEAASSQGVSGTESLGIAVPSLQFSRQTGNGGTPFIRGVGSTQAAAGSEAPVAVYIDDVYIGAPNATLLQFNNIESTEVLKGPQGTLFGRNATGGVVHIHTKRPSQTFGVTATVGGGSYDTYFGNVYMTGPVTDKLAVSFAAAGQKQADGYGFNLLTGDDTLKGWNYGYRAQLAWDPGSATSVLLSADYSLSKSDVGMSVVVAPGTVGLGGGTFRDRFGTYDTVNNPFDRADFSRNEVYGVSGRLQHDFGGVSLVSVTAYREAKQIYQLDSDAVPAILPVLLEVNQSRPTTTTFSQEVQLLSGPDGPFKWIVGGFYYRSKSGYDPLVFRGSIPPAGPQGGALFIEDTQTLNSYSGFGEASYEFLPAATLTLGLRYTSDQFDNKVALFRADGVTPVNFNNPAIPTGRFTQDDNFSKLTYRAIADYKVTPDILLYASYSRGFKSGGYNLSSPTVVIAGVRQPAPAVSPEVLDAYEIGLKSDLFERQVRVNLAAYHYDYSNLQVTSLQNGASITVNAATARIRGVDVDLNYVPNRSINLGAAFSFLDAKFTKFPSGPINVPNPASCTPIPRTTGPLTGGNTSCFGDLGGNRTTRAPKFTMTLTGTYTLPTDIGEFSLNTTLYHNSGFFWEPDNRFAQPTYDLLNATLAWTSPDETYQIRVYGRNLLNKYYYSYFSESSRGDSGSPEMPRNYGAALTVRF